jgi:RNA polymerase sigma factor (sigma-70 family)
MAVNPVLDFLRWFRASDQVRKSPDAEVLARFVSSRDEAAFTALVQRHGPMVLRVCVRILGNSPDAEDAFQAAFLVLARRASSVSRPELLGNWLYGVAHRTALKVRANTARRQSFRRDGGPVDGSDPANEASRRELRRVLDHELSRLPDRYRVPLVLHYLEGRTQEEVAHLLGCPRNTVATRLARACERLRGRLARNGVALSSGALAAALSEEASAALPATLLDATVKAAMLFVAGGSALPSTVTLIAEGVIQAMFITKVKVALACVLLLGAVATGAGVLARQGQTPGGPQQAQIAAPKDNPDGADVVKATLQVAAAQQKQDQDLIQGSWKVVRLEHEGKVNTGPF